MRIHLILSLLVAATSAMAQQVTSLTATFETTLTKGNPRGEPTVQTVTSKYYRDSMGRTRTERGDAVEIADPVAGAVTVLDLKERVARVSTQAAAVPAPAPVPIQEVPSYVQISESETAPVSRPQQIREAPVDLGFRTIEGVQARGTRTVIVVPAGGFYNPVPIRVVIESWVSRDLQMILQVNATEGYVQAAGDRLISERSRRYKDIVPNAALDPALFTLPAGFRVVESGATP
jgi:hypothetical protein